MTDLELLQQIRAQYGNWIQKAVAGTVYPPALLAALTANESGLNPTANRFEKNVFCDLALLISDGPPSAGKGGADHYGAVTRDALLASLPTSAELAIQALRNLATSWGPTQIMGWQSLAGRYPLPELVNLQQHYPHTVQLLEGFRKQFGLGPAPGVQWPAESYDVYFRCWNADSPTGRTFDPNYSGNGVARFKLYEGLS